MDLTDRKLLNIIQSKFPLVDRPYLELGNELGIDEGEIIDRLAGLKKKNVLRQLSAIFDTRRLGYKTTLVAMAFEPGQLNKGALRINKHPGVSHNYAREGSYFNLWFTLAVPHDHDLESTVQGMGQDTKALSYRMMPTIRFFKIGGNFDMVEKKGSSFDYRPDSGKSGESKISSEKADSADWNKAAPLTDTDKGAIRELQEDLELIPQPFDDMASRLGIDTDQLFAMAADVPEVERLLQVSIDFF